MFKYIYLKWHYLSWEKTFEAITVLFLLTYCISFNAYLFTIVFFVTFDVDFIKALQNNAFLKSYYYNGEEKLSLFLGNFINCLIFILIITISLHLKHALIISVYYSFTSAVIIQCLYYLKTNRCNLFISFMLLQAVAHFLIKGVSYVV